MSSTFVTRLKVGKSSLTRRASPSHQPAGRHLAARSLQLAALAALLVAILASPALRNVFGL